MFIFSLSQNKPVCVTAEQMHIRSSADRPRTARGFHGTPPSGGSQLRDKPDPSVDPGAAHPSLPAPRRPAPGVPALRLSWALGESAQPGWHDVCVLGAGLGPWRLLLPLRTRQGWRRLGTARVPAIPGPIIFLLN